MRALHSIAAATLLASAALAAVPALAASADKLYVAISPSVWRVFSYNAQGLPFAQGSAVVIGPETLLTNCHVLAKAKSFAIKRDNVSLEAKLQYIDLERDMCQITARNLKAPAVAIGDSDKLVVGQRIYALGNPEGMELTLSDGLVSSLRKDDKQRLRYIQITAPISHGSSGGGLFDEDGRLVGITSGGIVAGQNLNLAIPIKWVAELAARSSAALAGYQIPDAPARPAAPRVRAAAPPASGYAELKDVAKLAALNPRAKAGYEDFLTRPFPRAFALSESGAWWASWGWKPKNPASDPDPTIRAVPDCENAYQRRCHLYAVDETVVYKDEPTPINKAQDKP